MPTATDAIQTMSIGDSFTLALIGLLIVFFVLVVLMAVIKILRGIVESMAQTASVAAPALAGAPSAAPAANPNMVPAKGSLGDIKLYNVDDKTAALIMAIIADKMEAPLNELRFISIREKKREEKK